MNVNLVYLLNLVATWYMVGLIWMVQIVHYKLFNQVGAEEFVAYENDHSRLITPIVGIPMLVEIVTAGLLVAMAPTGFPRWAAIAGVVMVIGIWASTALIQVPCHARLAEGFDMATYQRLVTSNWIRTILWSARGVLMASFVVKWMPPS